MIRGIGEEVGVRFRREHGQRRAAAVALGEDDLVEELDGGVFTARGFALVDKLVEHLCLAEHVHVLGVAVWDALEESVHVEVVDQACLARFSGGRVEILAVSVEERGEASNECSSDLIGAESGRAREADCRDATSVDSACAG